MEQVIIIGSGPAGYTAAIYAARARLSPVLFEGYQTGGQLMLTTEVENFPGFPKGIMGPELMQQFRAQAERFETNIRTQDVTKVDFSTRPFKVYADDDVLETHSVIIATGASAKWLGIESEKKWMGRGVSSCATCDGAFFKDQEVAIVGGGDSAMEEAIFLTRFARKVTVIHRREQLRASQIMQDRARKNEKIAWKLGYEVDEILGQQELTGIRVRSIHDQSTQELSVSGVFVAIGHTPNTKLFEGQIQLTPSGYIITKDGTYTSVKGVFACGDVQDHVYRQAITAAGSGCMAAIDCERYLEVLALDGNLRS